MEKFIQNMFETFQHKSNSQKRITFYSSKLGIDGLTSSRRVMPYEYHKYQSHLKNLDVDSRFMRFSQQTSDYVIDEFCNNISKNIDKHVLFAIEDNDFNFVAVGHIALFKSAELAISVLPEYQNKKLGSKLMAKMINYCRLMGIEQGYMTCLPNNYAARKLCINHGIEIKFHDGDCSGKIEFEKPDASLMLDEYNSVANAVCGFFTKRVMYPFTIHCKT